MDHHHDVRARFQCEAVTRLLIPAVTRVLLVDMHLNTFKSTRYAHRVIATAVIHEDDVINYPLITNFVVSLAQSFRRVVGRHDNDHFFSAIHGRQSAGSCAPNQIQPCGQAPLRYPARVEKGEHNSCRESSRRLLRRCGVCIKHLAVQPDVVNRLREMGLGEEQRIRLISRHPSLICQVCNARVALSQELAESILVEPLRKAS
jgi:Fe2+ transport system protein FeoA